MNEMMTQDEIQQLRAKIEAKYRDGGEFPPTGYGDTFEELLCHEIHGPALSTTGELVEQGLTFKWLAEKWKISLPVLGELIWDHCKKL